MKKIGILTFHRAVNYGACLQAYALKAVCQELGADVQIIDYRSKNVETLYRKMFQRSIKIRGNVKNFLTWDIQKQRNRQFDSFVQSALMLPGQESLSKEQLPKLNDVYDVFISGSDQVWGPRCINGDFSYLLDFVNDPAKKLSYAASFGITDDNYLSNPQVKELIQQYELISVREQKGMKIASELTDHKMDEKIGCHLDPTFLPDKSCWDAFVKESNEKYIFVYSLTSASEVYELAKQLAQKTGLKIRSFTLNNLYAKLHPNEVITGSPEDFVNFIANADYVVTNSFHGTAFSLIFHKKFFVVRHRMATQDNSRLVNILDITGFSDRLVEPLDSLDLTEPDYSSADRKLAHMRQESLDYLQNIIKG